MYTQTPAGSLRVPRELRGGAAAAPPPAAGPRALRGAAVTCFFARVELSELSSCVFAFVWLFLHFKNFTFARAEFSQEGSLLHFANGC